MKASLTTPHEVLESVFGYRAFRGQQETIIRHVLEGKDALVLMPTGGGKSLCYQIPALLRPGVGVVISPLIALMQDQVDALGQLGVRAAFLNSTLDAASESRIEAQARRGELDLVYLAPERVNTERGRRFLDALAARPGHRAVRDRRGALRVVVGARLPAGLPGARAPRHSAGQGSRASR